MKDYEELLTLGEYLTDEERHDLYRFLLSSKLHEYSELFSELSKIGTVTEQIANCEIRFELSKGRISNYVRKIGAENFESGYRSIRIWSPLHFPKSRTAKYFAQCEVDVIRNFPLPGANIQEERSYSFNTYPYYELSYYSNGKGRIRGLINKLKTDDSELLRKLSA